MPKNTETKTLRKFTLTEEDERAYAFQQIEKEAREDVLREVWGHLDSTRKLRFISFISTSNGKERQKRKAREVIFLKDSSPTYGTVTYQIVHGEIQRRRSKRGLSPDLLAQQVLTSIPPDERTADRLLEYVIDKARRLSKIK